MEKEKSFIVLKVGTIPNGDGSKIERFLSEFVRELRNHQFYLEEKPKSQLSSDDVKHSINLINEVTNGKNKVKAELLLVFYADKALENIKNELIKNFRKDYKIYVIQISSLNSYLATNIQIGRSRGRGGRFGVPQGETRLTSFCKNFIKFLYGNTQENFKAGTSHVETPKKKCYPIAFSIIDSICQDLDSSEIWIGSSDFFIRVNVPPFFERLNDPWIEPKPEKQTKFLRIIVATASATQADLLQLTHEFLMKVLDSELVTNLVNKHVLQMLYDAKKRTGCYVDMVDHLVSLLVLGFDVLPSRMDQHFGSVQQVLSTLKNQEIINENFPAEKTKERLERLDARITAKTAEVTLEDHQKVRDRRIAKGSAGAPPEDFRQLTVMPEKYDIIDVKEVYLRPNVGRYENSEHYLDVHFRLMREDLLRPLREGIQQYRQGGLKETDLFVYKNIKFDMPKMNKSNGEFMYNAHLKIRRKLRWNKRLKYGSLLCLSSDGFKTDFIFAVVIDRENLPKAIVGLKFDNPSEIDLNAEYSMVESPAFFEAYKHVMLALQSVHPGEEIPFAEYLLGQYNNPQLPEYLLDNITLNFKCLLPNTEEPEIHVNVPYLDQYLTYTAFGMDRSQFEALHYALTSDLAVIQGPPGTGKTFIGLQIARLLLENERVWDIEKDSPMLVVCYTNHALDQFLEEILKFMKEGVIRIGNRSKNPALEQCMLFEARRRFGDRRGSAPFHNYMNEKRALNEISESLNHANEALKQLKSGMADPKHLLYPMEEYKGSILTSGAYLYFTKNVVDWLTKATKTIDAKPRDAKIDAKSRKQSVEPDFWVIQELMKMGFDEISAKNASFLLHGQSTIDMSKFLSKNRNNPERECIYTRLHPSIENWPRLEDLNLLIQDYGIHEEVAIQLLLSCNGDIQHVINNLHMVQRFFDAQKAKDAAQNPLDQTDGLQDDDLLLYIDDDDRDRMLFDQDDLLEDKKRNDGKEEKETKEGKKKWFPKEKMQIFERYITSAPSMSEDEVLEIQDIWKLSLQDRWRLFQFWHKKAREPVKNSISDLEDKYRRTIRRVYELRSLSDLEVLKNAKVIGMTTTGAAMHQAALRALKPKIVIIEEAAEILEAHLVTSLTPACEHVILIGDHQQLRPNPTVYELATKYNLEISLFERLIKNQYPYKALENQHRMRPEISRTLMPHFYQNLRDDASVNDYPHVRGMQKDLVFFNHNEPEVNDQELKSHSNPFEARMAIRLAKYFKQQNYEDEQITILCTYLDQLIDLRKMAEKELQGWGNGKIRIENVDNYQGEECDIIILSLVRSNNPQNKIGFLNITNRVCVALSRAKIGLYVLANMDFLAENCELWQNIKTSVENAGILLNHIPIKCQIHKTEEIIQDVKDFNEKCPEGGCRQPCTVRMDCGHTCMKPCHAYDPKHEEIPCTKPCGRTCPEGHPCKKTCYVDCGQCQVKVKKLLPCKHIKEESCYMPPDHSICNEKCSKILQCGHNCTEKCGMSCTINCNALVERVLKCGHKAIMECHLKPENQKCKEKVEKTFPFCQHRVEVECHIDVYKEKCPQPCEMPLPECEHLCKGTCGDCRNGRLHIRCQEECKNILVCGHKCESNCSKVCPPCEKACETACGHSRCGHATFEGGNQKKLRKQTNAGNKKKNKGRLCGDPCPPCAEPCLNECTHRKCDRLCWEACEIEPCQEKCNKKLKCSPNGDVEEPHLCLGVCGEECLEICKVCTPEKYEEAKEVLFGTEEDEDARFIQLKDCKHYVEVKSLDNWILQKVEAASSSTESNENGSTVTEIVTIDCPKCKTQIRRSKRYMHILNKRSMDIEQVKHHLRGKTKAQLKIEWQIFVENFGARRDDMKKGLERKVQNNLHGNCELEFVNSLDNLYQEFLKISGDGITVQWQTIAMNILRIVDKSFELAKNLFDRKNNFISYLNTESFYQSIRLRDFLEKLRIRNLIIFLWDELLTLVSRISTNVKNVSEVLLQQMTWELQRFGFLDNLFKWVAKFPENYKDIDAETEEDLSKIFAILFGNQEFKDKIEENLNTSFELLRKRHPFTGLNITEQERIEIVKALGTHVTKWYKCSKGHIYGIGECGQAMQLSVCPECKEEIGGSSHQLVSTSSAANEMALGVPMRQLDPFDAVW